VVAASDTGVSSLDPDLSEEAALHEGGFRHVAGVDEAGRGAWAGPLVAAAVILPEPGSTPDDFLAGVRDSKLCSPELRETLFEDVVGAARAVGVGAVAADEIDLLGLTAANELAMIRALRALHLRPDFVLVDCFKLGSLATPQKGIVQGDRRCLSIAAASIVAKVYRDAWLAGLDGPLAAYGFERHRGYGVAEHRKAIGAHGVTEIHRQSYAPLRAILGRP
jgi:ribonuclease HII